MKELTTNDWETLIQEESKKTYFQVLKEKVNQSYNKQTIYPKKEEIFTALKETPLESVKVVILGQDPYHEEYQAHGLSFSVLPEIRKIPPSLKNIYKELNRDLGCYIPNNGYLMKWAKQGVLLLNTVLTVKAGEANSHKDFGWETFTDAIIRKLNEQDRPMVYLLWGNYAQSKESMITNPYHLVLKSSHPSPFSARKGFLGCGHFGITNQFLAENGITAIDWQIEDIPVTCSHHLIQK